MFGNTPMQMFRRHKRRIQDIANNRGNMTENILSAAYYGAVQTMIFSYLANAMFAKDEDDLEKEESGFYHLHKPMALVAGQQGLGLAPYMFSVSQDSTFKIKDSVIACVLKTEKELASQYMQQTTGIAI